MDSTRRPRVDFPPPPPCGRGCVALLLLAAIVACGRKPPEPESEKPASDPAVETREVVLDPAPPAGIVVPRGVIVVEIRPKESGTAFVWLGRFKADPDDSAIGRTISEARAKGESLTARDAALATYRDDVRAAGREVSTFAFADGFDYSTAQHAVFVRIPDDADADSFEIVVALPGG